MSRVTPPSTASAGLCGHSQVHTSLDGSFQSSAAARTVSRAQVRAQAQLLSAVSCERALRWSEVVEHYTALLKTLSKEELPKDFEPGPYHSQLDAYCVRALVWSTLKEEKRALFDLNCSQKLKPLHISTLIIKGAIKNSLLATGDPESLMKNKDHEKAYKLDKDSKNFFDVKDFLSPKMADFYDRLDCTTPTHWYETDHPPRQSLRRTSEGQCPDQNNQMFYRSGEIPVVPQCSSHNNASQFVGWKFINVAVTI